MRRARPDPGKVDDFVATYSPEIPLDVLEAWTAMKRHGDEARAAKALKIPLAELRARLVELSDVATETKPQFAFFAPHRRIAHAPHGFVYFVAARAVELIKIGHARNPADRLVSLQVGSPVPLSLLGVVPGRLEMERRLHAQFVHLRSHGEWYRADTELLEFMHTLLASSGFCNTSIG